MVAALEQIGYDVGERPLVIAVLAHDGDDDAVRIANDSNYGLSGTVFSPDMARAIDIARQVRTGTDTINHLRQRQPAGRHPQD